VKDRLPCFSLQAGLPFSSQARGGDVARVPGGEQEGNYDRDDKHGSIGCKKGKSGEKSCLNHYLCGE
jgi:hypothetical protein